MKNLLNNHVEKNVKYACEHEVKGILFGQGINWIDDNTCELHYGSYDNCQDKDVFMAEIKKGLLGNKEQNSVYGYSLVRMGNIFGKYSYYPVPLLREKFIDGTISKTHLSKLKKVCKTLRIRLEDIKE